MESLKPISSDCIAENYRFQYGENNFGLGQFCSKC